MRLYAVPLPNAKEDAALPVVLELEALGGGALVADAINAVCVSLADGVKVCVCLIHVETVLEVRH
jgi:hypothetical protein